MKIIIVFFVFLISLVSCNSSDKKGRINTTTDDINVIQKEIDSKVADTLTWIHLKDTLKVNGKTIVVLRPDSLRFDSYLNSGKEWIYEVDSDFAFGVTQALDSFENNTITNTITDKRFIRIHDCKECPILIDRDTIEYGIILTSPTRNIQMNDNIAGKEYYLELFQQYFQK